MRGKATVTSPSPSLQVLDLTSMDEVACYTGQHSKSSRLFRQEGGITNLSLKPGGRLYSSGVDGSISCRILP